MKVGKSSKRRKQFTCERCAGIRPPKYAVRVTGASRAQDERHCCADGYRDRVWGKVSVTHTTTV